VAAVILDAAVILHILDIESMDNWIFLCDICRDHWTAVPICRCIHSLNTWMVS